MPPSASRGILQEGKFTFESTQTCMPTSFLEAKFQSRISQTILHYTFYTPSVFYVAASQLMMLQLQSFVFERELAC